jgi:hypothetical protein
MCTRSLQQAGRVGAAWRCYRRGHRRLKRERRQVGPEVGPTSAFLAVPHRNAWASLHILGQPNILLAGGVVASPTVPTYRLSRLRRGSTLNRCTGRGIRGGAPLIFSPSDHRAAGRPAGVPPALAHRDAQGPQVRRARLRDAAAVHPAGTGRVCFRRSSKTHTLRHTRMPKQGKGRMRPVVPLRNLVCGDTLTHTL